MARTRRCGSYEAYPGAASHPLPPEYRPRQPEKSELYQLVEEHVATFLESACERSPSGFGVPRFVERTFSDYLNCGVLALGFCRVRCDDCGREMALPFSCKRRGLCPSCDGRRMADSAAHLVDRVLPRVPYRQWTMSFPKRIRFALAQDGTLLTSVLRAFLQVVFAWQRRQARALSVSSPSPGAVTAIARAGGMANLNIHFHSILPDGVFACGVSKDAPPAFVALTPPTDTEVEALLLQIATRVERLVARHAAERELSDEEPDALTLAQGESVMAPAAQRVLEAEHASRPKPRCAFLEGYSLHADVAVHQNDRLGLERLCRYILRPAIATDRLQRTDDGLVRYRFRRPDAAGQTEIRLAPEDFLARLATLIPPPRQNLLRYHGCFAPRSALRVAIVPRIPKKTRRRLTRVGPSQADSPRSASHPDASDTPDPETLSLDSTPASATPSPSTPASATPSPSDTCDLPSSDSPSDLPATLLSRRLDWAGLLQRVFDIDVSRCAHCGGRVRILAVLAHPDIAHPAVEHLGLPTRLPTPAPARSPPQLHFDDWDQPLPDDLEHSTP